MSLILELPLPINEELTQESQREGISEMEYATLLVCLASAFKQEEPATPFQKAVRVFLSYHSLDAERVFSVFEELARVCLDAHDAGKSSRDFQDKLANAIVQGDYELLKHWRNSFVHQSVIGHPLDLNPDLVLSSTPPSDTLLQAQGRTELEPISDKEVTDPKERVRALLAKWQADDRTPTLPPIPRRSGETPTQALFRKWEEEDDALTDEEREAEDRLWEEFQQGINAERAKAGMRTLF